MVEIWRLYKELNANKMDISPNFTYWKMTLVLFNPIFFLYGTANHTPTGLSTSWFFKNGTENPEFRHLIYEEPLLSNPTRL